jgi:hypothetical protein
VVFWLLRILLGGHGLLELLLKRGREKDRPA